MKEQRIKLIADAAMRAADYVDQAADTPVFPTPDAVAALDGFDESLPEYPTDADSVIRQLDQLGSPATVRTTSGRYFGFVNGGCEPVATAASILSTVWDQNLAQPVMSPAGARLDSIAARWVIELLQLPRSATAAFCAGATIANTTCIVAARDALLARAGWDVAEEGLCGSPAINIVTSKEVHVSVLKSLRVAGFGNNSITFVDTDSLGRIRSRAIPEIGPMTLVILQAGNVNTGHSDPFSEILPRVQSAGAWGHIDGAFGLWAAASPNQEDQVAGAELADSWATDAHKWLNTPYDSGIAICAREEDLRRSMETSASYLMSESGRALMHLGLQMSQRARGVEVWSVLATLGRQGIAALIDRSCALASRMANQLSSGGATLLVPVGLNQVLVSFENDAVTDSVIDGVQKDRTCWVGGTTWQGQRAMRISVSDSATTHNDIDESANAILRCWSTACSVE